MSANVLRQLAALGPSLSTQKGCISHCHHWLYYQRRQAAAQLSSTRETWTVHFFCTLTASEAGDGAGEMPASTRARKLSMCRAGEVQETSESALAESRGIPTEVVNSEYCVVKSNELQGTTQRCTIRDVPGTEADLLADTLLSLGAQSASVTEHRPHGKEEQEIFDMQQGTREVWDRCVVTAYFAPDLNVGGAIQIAKSALQLNDLQEEVTLLADSDWADGICASYQPTCITEKLWIIPSWYDPKDTEAINVRVEPGLAFGTGEHPTTRLCLRALSTLGDLSGKHLIDYGTGSGVLALTALKLGMPNQNIQTARGDGSIITISTSAMEAAGASLAVGTDTDALAVRAASQNGVLNKFGGKWITLQCGPSIEDPDPLSTNPQGFLLPTTYDICTANILQMHSVQKPLLELRPRLSKYVKPGGHILLSGILTTQAKAVQQAYEEDFEGFQVHQEEVWALLTATRKAG